MADKKSTGAGRGSPRQYPLELKERAIRMVLESIDRGDQRQGLITRIARRLDIGPESLRRWVVQAEIDRGQRPGTTSDEALRIAELERENRELRRANEILKSASVSSTGRCDSSVECSGRGREAERLAGSSVQLERDAVKVLLAVHR